jgi:hypothetical protein
MASPTGGDGGPIQAYAAGLLDLSLTAANHCGICTFAVTGAQSAPQLAFVSGSDPTKLVCEACHVATGAGSAVGVRTFVCRAGQREAEALAMADSRSPANYAASLGARVSLNTEESCTREIERWAKEETRLQPQSAKAAGQPDPATRLRIRLYKNGVSDELKCATVFLPVTGAAQIDMLLQEAKSASALFILNQSYFIFAIFLSLRAVHPHNCSPTAPSHSRVRPIHGRWPQREGA